MDMDVEITIDAVVRLDEYDAAVFLTGDSDFHSLIKLIINKSKEVHIMPSRASVSKELRTGATSYKDLLKIPEIWGNTLKPRKHNNKNQQLFNEIGESNKFYTLLFQCRL